MQIAREGIPIILTFLVLHLVFLSWGLLYPSREAVLSLRSLPIGIGLAFAILTLFSLYFFRDPERVSPEGAGLVVSPADGRVLGVDNVESGFSGPGATRVSIFMNVFDVHVNRAPVSGTVLHRHYHPGRFLNASLDKASEHNESLELGIETGEGGHRVLVKQIAGLVARRIVCRVDQGDTLERGQRYGMIRFGSRLEVTLPEGSSWKVSAGDRVRAGTSILAELP